MKQIAPKVETHFFIADAAGLKLTKNLIIFFDKIKDQMCGDQKMDDLGADNETSDHNKTKGMTRENLMSSIKRNVITIEHLKSRPIRETKCRFIN